MRGQLADLLLDVKAVLDTHGVDFWLNDGTLLGAVRDGDFIPWEKDIDLGAWVDTPDETKEKVAGALRDKGYKVLLTPIYMTIRNGRIWADIEFYENKNGMAVLPQWLPVNSVGRYLGYIRTIMMFPHYYNVDKSESIFKHYVLGVANLVCGATPVLCRRVIVKIAEYLYSKVGYKIWAIPTKYFSEFDTMEFCGEQFKVPANPEAYLVFRYGEDWRTPKQDWKITDDKAVRWQREW